jgi:hypothetical protein
MTNNQFDTIRLYQVKDSKSRGFIVVGPDGDGLGLVRIETDDNNNFGKGNIVIEPEMALKLAEAIVAASQDAIKERAKAGV